MQMKWVRMAASAALISIVAACGGTPTTVAGVAHQADLTVQQTQQVQSPGGAAQGPKVARATITSRAAAAGHLAAVANTPVACTTIAPKWDAVAQVLRPAIEGYTSLDSAAPGTPVGLYVSAVAPRYQVEAYRMGFYGSTDACLTWTSAWTGRPPAGSGAHRTRRDERARRVLDAFDDDPH